MSSLVLPLLLPRLLVSGGSGCERNSQLCQKALGNLASLEPLWSKIGWWVYVSVWEGKKEREGGEEKVAGLMWFLWWQNQTTAFSSVLPAATVLWLRSHHRHWCPVSSSLAVHHTEHNWLLMRKPVRDQVFVTALATSTLRWIILKCCVCVKTPGLFL